MELGPETAHSALSWMSELGVGTLDVRPFPVMLALLKRNRMIRASFKEKAFRLQRESGKDITELSPDVLKRELGFSEYTVLFLSPIDSIIEGLRCGLELGVPVQGVDLEDAADGDYVPALIEDAHIAGKDFELYMARNVGRADAYRDEETDFRRELTMAARLKTLMIKYQRVVFTCGMAHWVKIHSLLHDDTIQPAVQVEISPSQDRRYKRVVVHPQLAASYVDLFPAVIRSYENRRKPASQGFASARQRRWIDTAGLFQRTLKRVYKKSFSQKDPSLGVSGAAPNLDTLKSFEMYLGNLCRLRHTQVPDLFMTVQAGKDLIGGEFATELARAFMKFPWTSPKKHPGCALLSPSSESGRRPGTVTFIEDGSRTGKDFFVRSTLSNSEPLTEGLAAYEWDEAEEYVSGSEYHAWHPWNCLISLLSFQALKKCSRKNHVKHSLLFEGSILNGIDVKSTIRAYSRGEEQVYVRDFLCESRPDSPSLLEAFPVVWLLSPEEHPKSTWNVLVEPSRFMRKHIQDKESFQKVVNAGGSSMVVVIGYGSSVDSQHAFPGGQDIRIERYHGILMFQPISWSNRQFARWAELTRYKRNPFCTTPLLGAWGNSDLERFYSQEHGILLKDCDWRTALILLALPFTRAVLTVVIPAGYRLEKGVYEKAKSYGVNIVTTQASAYSQEHISRISICHLAPAIKIDPECAYSRKVEQAIGESQMAYQHLLPPELTNFGGGR